jgi:L-lactate dehydrogenase complex protein LldG
MQEKAELVSAKVSTVAKLEDAFTYAAELCVKKEACQLLFSGCESPLSEPAEALCEAKAPERIIAAPGLEPKLFKKFKTVCEKQGVTLLKDGLRQHLAGIDIGFSIADYGVAATGSLIQSSNDEELRLATMISEIHVAVLPLSKIRATSFDVEDALRGWAKDGAAYTSFITGASRTADIERVLALGVHGPLELHILIWEDAPCKTHEI